MALAVAVCGLYLRSCIASDIKPQAHIDQLNEGLIAYATGRFFAARFFLQPLAEHDLALAQMFLGRMYAERYGVTKDCDRAVEWLSRAAHAGNADAAFDLALFTEQDRCVPRNGPQAIAWYELAAEHGDTRAQNAIGEIYLGRGGLVWDSKKAAIWFHRGVKVFDADAYYNLGEMYSTGKHVPKDLIEAYVWFDLSAAISAPDQLRQPTKATIVRDRIREELMPGQVAEGDRLSLKFFAELIAESRRTAPTTTESRFLAE